MVFDFPDMRQYSDYDCGASVVLDILAYYGEDTDIKSLISKLGTSKKDGTSPDQIATFFKNKKYKVDNHKMSEQGVKYYIDKRIPVILNIQAWHTDTTAKYDYSKEWADGHYIVAHGYDSTGFICDDPSSIGRAHILYTDLKTRWHDVDENNKKLYNLGIAVYGKKIIYNETKLIKIG